LGALFIAEKKGNLSQLAGGTAGLRIVINWINTRNIIRRLD
jgi:hypothetical protein